MFKALPSVTPEHCEELKAKKTFQTKSVLYAKNINIKSLTHVVHAQNYCVITMPRGICIAFDYGVLVFFDCLDEDMLALYEHLKPYADKPFGKKEHETMRIEVNKNANNKVHHENITLKEWSTDHLKVISDVISKSLKMDQFEQNIGEAFSKVEPIAVALNTKGKLKHSATQLLKYIGSGLISEHEMIGRIEMVEKPIVLWDNPELEPLYHQLMDEFEMHERHAMVDKKNELIARTAQTSLEVLQHRHSSRLEWYIIILILVSIVLEIYALINH